MAWTGVVLGLGILLMALGGLGIVGGVGIAVVGPEVVSDMGEERERNGAVLDMGGQDAHERRQAVAEARQEVRLAGTVVAIAAAAVFLLGGVLYAVARGVESSRRAPGTPL